MKMEAPVQLSTDILTSVKIKVPFQTLKKKNKKKKKTHTHTGGCAEAGWK